jgi:flagellar hook-basal body complex protein FliE
MINPLSTDIMHILQPRGQNISTGRRSDSVNLAFASILTDAFRDVNQTDASAKTATLELLTGESDDISGILIEAQKAELAINLALQIRNKFIDAYTEIMRMQV